MKLSHSASKYMHEVREILVENDIFFWLDSGTLLGAIRDKSFIKWDNDIDLGAWEKDFIARCKNKYFLSLCSKKGFQVYLLDDKFIFEKHKIPINISLYKKKDNRAYRSLLTTNKKHLILFKIVCWMFSVNQYNKIVWPNYFCHVTLFKHFLLFTKRFIPKKKFLKNKLISLSVSIGCNYIVNDIEAKYFSNFTCYTFYGRKYYIPENTYEYLAFRYGSDWYIECKNWNTVKNDGAVRTEKL